MKSLEEFWRNSLEKRSDEGRMRSLKSNNHTIDFCSNDYLGLAKNTEFQQELFKSAENNNRVLTGSTGSRLISGNSEIVDNVEAYIAEMHGSEAALLFPSGYKANLAVFSSIMHRHDTVITDEFIHRSVIDGCTLSGKNSGKIKVIIGSEAIQEGMNLQERTSDMYLLSLPYNFTSLRQVEGRAWRQGNQFENVRINYMLTNDSIDVFMLQKLQAKQARYLEAMKKGANVVDVSDVNTQELKTAIITNPETRANIEIELLKKKLQNEKDRYIADQSFVLRKYEDYTKVQEKVRTAEESLARVEKWAKDAGDDSTWGRHLTNYQANVNRARQELRETIEYLATKGVNVSEIMQQNKLTESKIAEFEQKLEKLPELQLALVNRYKKENEIRLNKVSALDYVDERRRENLRIFTAERKMEPVNQITPSFKR